jgi:hypothetical protein
MSLSSTTTASETKKISERVHATPTTPTLGMLFKTRFPFKIVYLPESG